MPKPAALAALIFDVDGTLADTEAVHLQAFNEAFAQEGLPWHWSLQEYTQLLEISGGKERMLHYWQQREPDVKELEPGARMQVVTRLHEIKTAAYEQRLADGAVQLRPGVLHLMQEAEQQGLALAIATTTSPVNIGALLRPVLGLDWRTHFMAVGDASTAPLKKPHPQVYLQVLKEMNLRPQACIALEDSHNGLRAALTAGLAAIVTPTGFTGHQDFSGALRVLPHLQGVSIGHLQAWLNERAAATVQ